MDDLVFAWEDVSPLVVDDAIELPQHNLISSNLGECHQVYSSGNFTCVSVNFTLKRRLGYYIFHTYIPTCLIVVMSWISFWIRPDAVPARVTLCVTSLLTLSTQHAQSQKSLPPVSYIKAIDIFMSCCTLFVFASLMEYALVNILMAADDKVNRDLLNSTLANMTTASTSTGSKTKNKSSRSKGTGVGGDDTTDSPATTGIGAGLTAATAATATAATNQSNIVAGGGSSGISAASATIDTSTAFNGRQSRSRERVIFHQQPSLRSRHPLYHSTSLSSHSFLHYSPQETHTFIRKKNRAIIADYISRWIFPLSFIFLNICYWTVYLD